MRRLCAALALLGCVHGQPSERVDIAEPAVIEASTVDAEFAAAKEEYDQGRYEDAARRLHALAGKPGLAPLLRGSALLQEGVCRVEAGQRAEAQALLRKSLEIFDRQAMMEPIDPTLKAQAEYWLGEAYDREFREVPLDPAGMTDDALSAALERKADLLLSAQGHFLRCVQRGDSDWAVASGARIGEMYEQLYQQIVNAPVPPGLTESQRVYYQQELRARARTLLEKAMRVYEDTLAAAERTGASGEAVARATAALERLRSALLQPN